MKGVKDVGVVVLTGVYVRLMGVIYVLRTVFAL